MYSLYKFWLKIASFILVYVAKYLTLCNMLSFNFQNYQLMTMITGL